MKSLWPTKKLGEVAQLRMGETLIKKDLTGDGVPVYSADSLEKPWGYTSKNKLKFRRGAIVIGARGTIGSLKLPEDDYFTSTQTTIVVEPNIKEILPEFLFYFLSTLNFRKGGTGIPMITIGYLKTIKVPLPPLKIQKKIVERLDAIKKAQELNDKQIELAEELFQSLLHCELDPKGKNWEVKKLGEIFYRQNETVVPAKDFPSENFNYIGLENIESNSGMLINFTKTLGENIKSSKFIFRKEDILYGKLRPYLNKVWLAEFDGICSTDIWVLRSKKDCALPLVLANILRSKEILLKTSSFMTGSNLPRVRKDYFDSIKIPLPSLEIQRKIVEKLSAVQEYKKKLLDQKQKLQELFESALNKSFKGELVG